ncbi:MAG: inositol monophosphatase family protein [Candidatus Limnocylindrales bacterium]|nr:inositol monophosphatase family protein [Candidatus Limnocylindrales bacterium]
MTEHAGAAPGFGPEWSASRRRAPETDLRAWLDLGLELCGAADEIALRWFRRDVPTATKPDRTFVTEADRAIERLIRARILAAHPDHGLVGEEYGVEAGGARVRWYIDPIDGTHNYMRGVPLFGTLLAVEVDGELQVGILSAPALGERWHAARGLGAWAIGRDGASRALRTSSLTALGDAQLLYGSRRENVESGLMPGFDATIAASWRDRGFGDFWGYALVAEGAAEAMIESGMHAWDVAAPLVLIEEAGGRVTDVTGARTIDAPSFVGSNGHLHDELLRRLTGGA